MNTKRLFAPRIACKLLLACSVACLIPQAFAGQLIVGPGESGDTTSDDIVVPAGVQGGYMDSTSGDVHLQIGSSATGVDTTSGNVVLDADARVFGKIDVTSGDITLGPRAQSATIDSTSGNVHVMQSAIVNGAIDTTSGDVRLMAGARSNGIDTSSGNVELAANVSVNGTIDTSSGYVVGTAAQIMGSIDTSSGDISLTASRVNGSVLTNSGRVHVVMRSVIGGNLKLRKNNCDWSWFSSCKTQETTVIIGANSAINGALIAERPVRLYVHPSARVGRIIGDQITRLTEAQAVAENPAANRVAGVILAEQQ